MVMVMVTVVAVLIFVMVLLLMMVLMVMIRTLASSWLWGSRRHSAASSASRRSWRTPSTLERLTTRSLLMADVVVVLIIGGDAGEDGLQCDGKSDFDGRGGGFDICDGVQLMMVMMVMVLVTL